jgi:hypothetical protein
MNHQELYKLLVSTQKNVRCPQCGKSYDFSAIQIRGIVDSIVFLELNCPNHMPLLATVTLSRPAKSQMRKATSDKIQSDDVIETYRFLKDWKGNFAELFGETEVENNNNKK